MALNVKQIDPKVIKPTNAIQTVRSRPQYKSDKISVVALFQTTVHPIAFNRKNVTPNKLCSFKSKRNKHRGALSHLIERVPTRGQPQVREAHEKKKIDTQISTF